MKPTQAEMEAKYSVQQWREKAKTIISTQLGELMMFLGTVINQLVKDQLNGYNKGIQWSSYTPSLDFIEEVFTVIIEAILRHCKYTSYVPYTAVLPGLIVACSRYKVGQDAAKAAFDLIWVMNKTQTGTWYSHGYTPHDNQGAIIADEGSIKVLKDLGLYEDLSMTIKSMPPMVEKPRKWRSNKEGAYLFHKAPLAKNGTANEVLAEYANLIQEQPFKLNSEILQKFDLVKFLQKGLPETKALRIRHRIQDMLEELEERDLYMIPFFDSRGRQYFYGWEINFQSSKLNKAMWELPQALDM